MQNRCLNFARDSDLRTLLKSRMPLKNVVRRPWNWYRVAKVLTSRVCYLSCRKSLFDCYILNSENLVIMRIDPNTVSPVNHCILGLCLTFRGILKRDSQVPAKSCSKDRVPRILECKKTEADSASDCKFAQLALAQAIPSPPEGNKCKDSAPISRVFVFLHSYKPFHLSALASIAFVTTFIHRLSHVPFEWKWWLALDVYPPCE